MGQFVHRHTTLVKTITYGLMHVTVAITLAYLLTGNWILALSIGLLEPAVQTCFFYMHEHGWIKASGWLGKKYA